MNKIVLEIDIDSMESLRSAQNIIKSHMGQLNKSLMGSKKDRNRLVFESCHTVWNTDISDLYVDVDLDDTPEYYLYAHCDPGRTIAVGKDGRSTFGASIGLNCVPFYIGQGKGNRAYDLNRNETHRKERQKLKTFGKEIEVAIIKDKITEKESLMLESKLIDIFGTRATGGILVNLDEGTNSEKRKNRYLDMLSNISSVYREIHKNLPQGKH